MIGWALRLLPFLAKVPGHYKAVAGLIVALALLSVAFASGFKVADWRAGASRAELVTAHAEALLAAAADKTAALAAQERYIRDLEAAVELNNRAIAVAAAQTQAAEAARAQAQKHAADLAAFSQGRMDRLQASFDTAASCADVLQAYWGQR